MVKQHSVTSSLVNVVRRMSLTECYYKHVYNVHNKLFKIKFCSCHVKQIVICLCLHMDAPKVCVHFAFYRFTFYRNSHSRARRNIPTEIRRGGGAPFSPKNAYIRNPMSGSPGGPRAFSPVFAGPGTRAARIPTKSTVHCGCLSVPHNYFNSTPGVLIFT